MNRTIIVFIVVVLLGSYQYWSEREVERPEGILVLEEPIQNETTRTPIKYKDVVLDPLAEFSLKARVLSTKRYWLDKMANLVPTDIALGWGVMSDTKVLRDLNIWQEGRFYFYSWKGSPPAETQLLKRNSANMHLIPSTDYIDQEIKKLRKGQMVSLKGYLVRVNYPDGSDAKSSLTRDDSGAGACEIIWVESISSY